MRNEGKAADEVFAALQALADHAGDAAIEGEALDAAIDRAVALGEALVLARRSASRLPAAVPAGRFVQAGPAELHAPGHGTRVPLAPATGTVAGIDEQRLSVRVFRTLAAGSVLGREVPLGARVLLSTRPPAHGDACVVRGRDGLFCGEVEPGDRVLGVVEAVIAAA